MSNIPKITIEKRIFKVGNNEHFILEYPSNYEEVVSRKLNNLQKEYDEAISNKKNNNNDVNKLKEIIDEEKNEEENNKKMEKKEENDINKEKQNCNYYQPIGDVDSFMNDDNDIKENLNNNSEKKADAHLEPQEGFIEIKSKKIEKEKENKIDNNKNEEKGEKEDNNEEEFYEVEEKENGEHNNGNIKLNKEEIKNDKKGNKRSSSPVNDPESVKLSMKSLNFKTPIWAENMSDQDFLNMAKNIISSKKKIP